MSARIKWTDEAIHVESLKFNTKADFKAGSPKAYAVAVKRKLLNDGVTCSHLTSKINNWDEKAIRAEALKFSRRIDFQKNSLAYEIARRRNMLNDGITCKHMDILRTNYDEITIRKEALKYSTKAEFQTGNRNAYMYAFRHDMLDDGITCKHMDVLRTNYDEIAIRKEALKFSTKAEFKKGNRSAYAAAQYRGMLDGEACSHLTTQLTYYTKADLRIEALKYKTRSDFAYGSPKHYMAAKRRNMLDDGITCQHMEHGIFGFDPNKPAHLYYLKIVSENDFPLYKIGITNRDINIRVNGLYAKNGIKISIIKEIWFENGAEARELEKQLHEEFKEYRYLGDAILGNGNTELYVTDVLNYDTQSMAA